MTLEELLEERDVNEHLRGITFSYYPDGMEVRHDELDYEIQKELMR